MGAVLHIQYISSAQLVRAIACGLVVLSVLLGGSVEVPRPAIGG